MNDARLFHLVERDVWRAHRALDSGAWEPGSLVREGFVHLSFAQQLRGTLALHFADVDAVLLFEVDGRALGADLVLEPSRGGELFPHLYRGIRHAELLRAWELQREAGAWRAPAMGTSPAADDPPAGPVI